MDPHTATEIAYKNGYAAGKTDTEKALKEGIENFLSDDDTEVIISEGEVFVPISALRKIVAKIEVK